MKNLVKKFSQFINESVDSDRDELASMGFKSTSSWEVMLEVDWDLAAQTEHADVKAFIEELADELSGGDYMINKSSINLDDWDPETDYWEEDEDDEDDHGSSPNYGMRSFCTFKLEASSDDTEETVKEWIDDNLIGRVFSDITEVNKIEE